LSFRLTRKAVEDLKSIARFTEQQWGKHQRNHYLRQLDAAFQELSLYPEQGINCGFIREGYRKWRVEKHLIFYRVIKEETIEIVRILHASRDIKSIIAED
jgi:toxin ParE1/3/4